MQAQPAPAPQAAAPAPAPDFLPIQITPENAMAKEAAPGTLCTLSSVKDPEPSLLTPQLLCRSSFDFSDPRVARVALSLFLAPTLSTLSFRPRASVYPRPIYRLASALTEPPEPSVTIQPTQARAPEEAEPGEVALPAAQLAPPTLQPKQPPPAPKGPRRPEHDRVGVRIADSVQRLENWSTHTRTHTHAHARLQKRHRCSGFAIRKC